MYGVNGWQCFFFFPVIPPEKLWHHQCSREWRSLLAGTERKPRASFFVLSPYRERVFVGTHKPWRIAACPVSYRADLLGVFCLFVRVFSTEKMPFCQFDSSYLANVERPDLYSRLLASPLYTSLISGIKVVQAANSSIAYLLYSDYSDSLLKLEE